MESQHDHRHQNSASFKPDNSGLNTVHLADLPVELLMIEIVNRLNLQDALAFCSIDLCMKKIGNDLKFWKSRFSSYNYLQKQEAVKIWAHSGLFVELLLKLVVASKDQIEPANIFLVYLYLSEHDPNVQQRSSLFANYPSYKTLFDPIRVFLASFRVDRETSVIEFAQVLDGPLNAQKDYFADLLINALTIDEIKDLLSAYYYDKLQSAFPNRISITQLLNYAGYRVPLYQALVRSKRINLLDPLFMSKWKPNQATNQSTYDTNISNIYNSIDNVQDEIKIASNLDEWESYQFQGRCRDSRATLISLLKSPDIEYLWDDVVFSRAHLHFTPEEFLQLLNQTFNEKGTIRQIAHNINATIKYADYPIWVNTMEELMDKRATRDNNRL